MWFACYVDFLSTCWFPLFHVIVLSLLGRIYLGMHSLVDIVGGIIMGLMILLFWILVNEYIDNFIVSGQNGMHISCSCLFPLFLFFMFLSSPLCIWLEISVNVVDWDIHCSYIFLGQPFFLIALCLSNTWASNSKLRVSRCLWWCCFWNCKHQTLTLSPISLDTWCSMTMWITSHFFFLLKWLNNRSEMGVP